MPEPRRLSGMQESERAQTETARAEGGVIMAKIRMVSPYFEETYMVIESAESIKNEFLNIKGGYYDNFFLTAVGRQGAPLPAKEVSIVVSPKNLALFEYWEEEV